MDDYLIERELRLEAERQAERWALREMMLRARGRLFPPGDMDFSTQRARDYAEDLFWAQPVAILSEGSCDNKPGVGIFYGFSYASHFMSGNLLYAIEFVLQHFSGPGCSTRGSHLSIIDMVRLPPGYDIYIPEPEEGDVDSEFDRGEVSYVEPGRYEGIAA